MCTHACLSVGLYVCMQYPWRPQEGILSLELELGLSITMWVLGTELLLSFTRAVCVLFTAKPSPSPNYPFLKHSSRHRRKVS